MATKGMETLDAAALQSLLGPELTAEQATLIFQQGQEAVVFALLTLAKQLAEKQAVAASPDPRHLRDKLRLTSSLPASGGPKPKVPSRDILDIVDHRRRGSTAGRITSFRPVPSAMVRFVLAGRRGPGSSKTSPPTSRRW